jgi:hypothetical protein
METYCLKLINCIYCIILLNLSGLYQVVFLHVWC